jgi:hypothetical protein
MEQPGMIVRFPDLRRRVRDTARVICEAAPFGAAWVSGDVAIDGDSGFDDAVNLFIDELDATVWPPSELLGAVLATEAELKAFVRLYEALERLVRSLAAPGAPDRAEESARWRAAAETACALTEAFASARA